MKVLLCALALGVIVSLSCVSQPVPSGEIAQYLGEIEKLMEQARNSNYKKYFKYDIDKYQELDSETGNFYHKLKVLVINAGESGEKLLKKYEKDQDRYIRALAYAILSECFASSDDENINLCRQVKTKEEIQELIRDIIEDIKYSKHGGHYTYGVDWDDWFDARCYIRLDMVIGFDEWIVLPVLKEYLDNENEQVQTFIELVCYYFRIESDDLKDWHEPTIKELIQILQDRKNGPKAYQAARDLGKKNDPIAIPYLIEALKGDYTREILQRRFPDGEEFIGVYNDDSVREMASESLKKITGKDFGQDYEKWKEWYKILLRNNEKSAIEGVKKSFQKNAPSKEEQ
jgi:hypothetical protein